MARPSKKATLLKRGAVPKAVEAIPVGGIAIGGEIGRGAKAVPHYRDRHEQYELVTRDDLREIRAFGWLQQSLFGVGTFFFSGAFWVFFQLLAQQEKFELTPWMVACVICMVFGLVLGGIGLILFALKQKRLGKYFPANSDNTATSKAFPARSPHTRSQPARQEKMSRRMSRD